jgi:hypothetical protein
MESIQMSKAELQKKLALVSKELAQAKKMLTSKNKEEKDATESRKRAASEMSTPIENELKAMLECPVCFETMVIPLFAQPYKPQDPCCKLAVNPQRRIFFEPPQPVYCRWCETVSFCCLPSFTFSEKQLKA